MKHEKIILKKDQDGKALSWKEITRDEKGLVTKSRIINNEPTRTDQTQKDQCNINNIMKKYNKKMELVPSPVLDMMAGTFTDNTIKPSFQEALHIVRDAGNAFASLPSHVRKRFSNDPKEMISFLQDPTNNEEAQKLGLKIKPTPPPEKTEAEKYYANQNAKHKTAKQTPSTGNTASDD